MTDTRYIDFDKMASSVTRLMEDLAHQSEFEAAGLLVVTKTTIRRGGPDAETYGYVNNALDMALMACRHETNRRMIDEVQERVTRLLAELTESEAEHEYAFDVTLHTVIRVNALSMEAAEAMLRDAFYSADSNFGAWPDGNPILASCTMEDAIGLIEIDGEAV
jgi:hypothetical protein